MKGIYEAMENCSRWLCKSAAMRMNRSTTFLPADATGSRRRNTGGAVEA